MLLLTENLLFITENCVSQRDAPWDNTIKKQEQKI